MSRGLSEQKQLYWSTTLQIITIEALKKNPAFQEVSGTDFLTGRKDVTFQAENGSFRVQSATNEGIRSLRITHRPTQKSPSTVLFTHLISGDGASLRGLFGVRDEEYQSNNPLALRKAGRMIRAIRGEVLDEY